MRSGLPLHRDERRQHVAAAWIALKVGVHRIGGDANRLQRHVAFNEARHMIWAVAVAFEQVSVPEVGV